MGEEKGADSPAWSFAPQSTNDQPARVDTADCPDAGIGAQYIGHTESDGSHYAGHDPG